MKGKRKFSSEFKTKIVLEALKERVTVEELASTHDLSPQQIHWWKTQFLERSSMVFDEKVKKEKDNTESLIKDLYAQIGELKVHNDWLKKKVL